MKLNFNNYINNFKSTDFSFKSSEKSNITPIKTNLECVNSADIISAQNKVLLNQHKYNIYYCHKDIGGTLAYGYPDDYVIMEEYEMFCEEKPAHYNKFKRTWVDAVPAHYERGIDAKLKPHYHLDKIVSGEKGYGTKKIKELVRESLNDKDTEGRVTLECCCIDKEKTCPAGFYYKLGFRFCNPFDNEECEKWIKKGGKRENSPIAFGNMYLPKENIEQCLNY